jgi:hypothetical protein
MTVMLDRVVEAITTRYFGKYRGEVTDTADPTNRGRVKVRVPSVMGDKELWAMPCAPYAGDTLGLFAIPPAGTAVWCEFEGGELNQPIWSGCFWKDNEIDSADARESVFFLKTPGLALRVDNQSGEVVIESSAGPRITMSSSGIKIEGTQIELSANGGSAKLSATGFDAMNGALTVGP